MMKGEVILTSNCMGCVNGGGKYRSKNKVMPLLLPILICLIAPPLPPTLLCERYCPLPACRPPASLLAWAGLLSILFMRTQ